VCELRRQTVSRKTGGSTTGNAPVHRSYRATGRSRFIPMGKNAPLTFLFLAQHRGVCLVWRPVEWPKIAKEVE
jgi:hypothetical protein